jgi:hypothetical protein
MSDLVPDGSDPGLRDLAAMWSAVDPLPTGLVARMQVVAAAEDLLITSDLDHELMLLVERRAELAGARGSAAHTLRFAYEDVDLLVRAAGSNGVPRTRLDGWIVPPGEVSVRAELLSADSTQSPAAVEGTEAAPQGAPEERRAAVDDNGRFEFADLPTGLVRLWLMPTDGTMPIATPVFEI